MSPTAIAYSELYASDIEAVMGYLTKSMGFRPVAVAGPETGIPDRRSTALRNGGVTIVVTAALDDTGEVAAFLERHGDSIADLGLTCADVETEFARATNAGAAELCPLTASVADGQDGRFGMVSAFGDVRHTLLGPPPKRGWSLPPDRCWELLPVIQAPDADPVTLRTVDHVAVCLPAGTLGKTVEFYRQAFGLSRYSGEYIEIGDQAMDSEVVRNDDGGVTLTLIEPDLGHHPGQIDQFLTAHAGAGVQHLAFLTDDIVDAVRTLGGRGVDFLRTPGAYYDVIEQRLGQLDFLTELRANNILVDRDEWGRLLQIFTRSPHRRGTLFYELIQRDGARGFGAANIKALYEAVERSRKTVEQ